MKSFARVSRSPLLSRSGPVLGRLGWIWSLGATLAILLAACGGGESPTGAPRLSNTCASPPYFTVLPVRLQDLDGISVIGGLDAPGHVLPTAHSGIFVNKAGVPFSSPGAIEVTQVRRVRYLTSPTREGERDYAVFFGVCRDVDGWFGHLTDVSASVLSAANFSNCETYSTPSETVESCTANVDPVAFAPGAQLGTAGLSVALGLLAVDFGFTDSRVSHFYASPSRYPTATLHAVCPYELFDATNRAILFSVLRDLARPTEAPTGQPRCGTMEVDVPGTVKGVWAEVGVSGRVEGDERRYVTLANYPYRPQEKLALSLGPAGIGARLAVVPRQASGRVNRAFEDVPADGLLYCYNGDPFYQNSSWFLALDGSGTLTIELIDQAGTTTPCGNDPSTWGFGAGAMAFIR